MPERRDISVHPVLKGRLGLVLVAVAGVVASPAVVAQRGTLRQALTFHAPFDGSVNAGFATGDGALYWAASFKERQAGSPGLPAGTTVQYDSGAGRFGGALRFTARKAPLVFYKGGGNMPYAASDWSGTVSFWLSTDPAGELEPGFCDPVQITPRAWNDAAFFVEFEKRPESIPFRLGAYADLAVWNPAKRRFADIPAAERPLITVESPFARGRWTHVLFTFERFNTGRADGVVRLFLDGIPRGTLGPKLQSYTWDPAANAIALGLNYIGLIDEVAIFNRALSGQEVRTVHTLKTGVGELYGAK